MERLETPQRHFRFHSRSTAGKELAPYRPQPFPGLSACYERFKEISDDDMNTQTVDRPERHGFMVHAAHRQALIAEAAYFRAAKRGFASGHELDDWIQAEREIDHLLFWMGRLPVRP